MLVEDKVVLEDPLIPLELNLSLGKSPLQVPWPVPASDPAQAS